MYVTQQKCEFCIGSCDNGRVLMTSQSETTDHLETTVYNSSHIRVTILSYRLKTSPQQRLAMALKDTLLRP